MTPHAADPTRQHHNVTLAVLTFAGIAFALQQTMILPALPTLQRELGTTTTWVTWLLTGFLLSASVATPILGKLGDQYGKERLLVISLGVFFLGSVGATFAWDIASLIGCRILQGAGAAVFPLSFSIIKDEFPREKVGVAVGIVSAVFGVGGGLGLVLSGVLIDALSWRWIFGVGAIGVGIAVVLVHLFVPESPIKTPSRVDVPGALLLSGGLVAMLVALSEGERWGWSSVPVLGLLVAAAVLLAAWVAVELRVPEPMVDMRMMTNRPVLFANVTGLIAGLAMFGTFAVIPQLVQLPNGLPPELARMVDYGFGASATKTGLYLVPGAIAGFFTGPLAGILGRRFGPHVPMAIGVGLAAVGFGLLVPMHEHSWQIFLGMGIAGAGIPMSFAAMAHVIVQSVRQSETGIATGMNTVMRTVGGVVGGQVVAAILAADTLGATSVPAESAFTIAFAIAGVGSALAIPAALLGAPRRAGRLRAAAQAE